MGAGIKQIRRRQPASDSPLLSNCPHPLLARIYRNRGIRSEAELELELARLEAPTRFAGMAAAQALLADVVMAGEPILIIGDFDADGATSSALAVLALRAMGADADFLVPNRFEYGYGLTPEIVAVAQLRRPRLLVTVDNGISSIEGVAAARDLGMQVLITDHHLPGEQLPLADAIVNPNQPGCDFPSKHLAGVGVIFYVLTALRSELRQRGWFDASGRPEPRLADYLDLVALGTVADVVPLDHCNRILVQQGLARIRAGRTRPGILALLEVARRDPSRAVASDLSFMVGPRLNAAGRLDDISIGIQCLLTEDPAEARELAAELDTLNRDRRSIEQSMQREALASLDALTFAEGEELPWGLCLYRPDWHQGVIGILASRIKDRYHRPVIAFADAEENTIKGSARSIPGLHIRDALDTVAARHPQLLSKFGGHAMAAGMSLQRTHFEAFTKAFDSVVRELLDESDLTAVLWSDGELGAEELELEAATHLREAGPWGQNFPEPLFDGIFRIVQQRAIGDGRHLKLVLAPDQAPERLLDAVAFNIDATRWPNPAVEQLRAAYRLDVNVWRGRASVQLLLEYLEPV